MVADATQGAEPTTKPIVRGGTIPLGLRLRCENLYLNRGFTPSQIATETGLTPDQVSNLASRGNWTKLRKARLSRVQKELQSREASQVEEVERVILAEADEHSLESLQCTGEALRKKNAKDAQAFSATLRNLVTVSRAIRAGSSEVGQSGSTQVNLFFFRPSSPMEKQVTEERSSVVEIAATVVPAVLPPAS